MDTDVKMSKIAQCAKGHTRSFDIMYSWYRISSFTSTRRGCRKAVCYAMMSARDSWLQCPPGSETSRLKSIVMPEFVSYNRAIPGFSHMYAAPTESVTFICE